MTGANGLTLANSFEEELPDSFIICSSNQKRADSTAFYQLYGGDGPPWISIHVLALDPHNSSKPVEIWANIEERAYNFGEVGPWRLHYWYHVCLHLDTGSGHISTAVNGKMINNGTIIESIKNKPRILKLVLGKSYFDGVESQYYWSVTNINIFYDGPDAGKDITKLTKNLCSYKGDFLAWSDSDMVKTGDHVTETDLEPDTVCGEPSERYQLAVVEGMSQSQAIGTCHSLNEGYMVGGATDKHDLEQYVEWSLNKTGKECQSIWTPLSDEEFEGVYVNLEDGTQADYLPWYPGYPKGGGNRNYISIWTDGMPQLYWDVSEEFVYKYRVCYTCSLRYKLLRLKGVCQHSFLGKDTIFN